MSRNEGLSRCPRAPGRPLRGAPGCRMASAGVVLVTSLFPNSPSPLGCMVQTSACSPPARLSAVSGALCGGEPAGPAGASAAAALKGRRSSRLHFARLPSQLLKVARLDPCPPARPQDPPTFLFKTPGPSPPRPSSALPLLRKLGSPITHGRPCFFTLLFFSFPLPRKVPAACGCPSTSPPRALFRQTTSFNVVSESSQRVCSTRHPAIACGNDAFTSPISPVITAILVQRRLDDRQTLGRKDSIAWF